MEMPVNYQVLGDRLRLAREQARLNQTETAQGLGLTSAATSQLRELYKLTGSALPVRLHHAFPALPERSFAFEEVELYAENVRRHFDLGSAPLRDVKIFLEGLSTHVFGVGLGERQDDISGLFFIHPELGAIVAVNMDQYYGRRSFTLAHEFAHVLFHYDRPPMPSALASIRYG